MPLPRISYPPCRETLIASFKSLLYIYSPSHFYPQLNTIMRSATPQSKITLITKKKSTIKCQTDRACATEREKKLCRPPQLRLLINIINTRMQEPTENSNTYTAGRKKTREMRASGDEMLVLRLKETAISGEKWKEIERTAKWGFESL